MFDAVQDMEGEPGLELAIPDIDRYCYNAIYALTMLNYSYSTLGHVVQNIKAWSFADPHQALGDQEEILARVDVELRIMDECGRLHVLGLEKQWELAYAKAKARDEAEPEDKLLKIAEIADLEPESTSKAGYPDTEQLIPSTAMERLMDEGFRRSSTHRTANGETEAKATNLDIKGLSQEYNDSVDAVASYYPLSLVPSELVPVILLATQDAPASTGGSAGHNTRMMQKLSHIRYVTISDIKKVENTWYLHNIRDLASQVQLYGA
ncbi:Tyrosine kinase catalytic domain protein [Ceratobasidium sp. AG-Ba]|nr:Tyrosine kinase catalytic domain protein [Ceratobasidium sp. AG-Ba]